ncbi:MAG: class I SAM-dependent methyltransferase [Chthoniobacterales bacterium]
MYKTEQEVKPAGLFEKLTFFREYLRQSAAVGAVCPSSPRLCELLVEQADVKNARQVVEVGPGSGAVTQILLKRVSPSANVFLIEQNPVFSEILQKKFPSTNVIAGCASKLLEYLEDASAGPVCSVVSGLPWASLPNNIRLPLLDAIETSLVPRGVFATFAYFGPHWLPKGRVFRKELKKRFVNVSSSRVELLNLPPAFVYRAEKAA